MTSSAGCAALPSRPAHAPTGGALPGAQLDRTAYGSLPGGATYDAVVGGATYDGVVGGCSLAALEPRPYLAPTDRVPRALDPILRSFTAARNVASAATVRPYLADPRVQVLPHVADAYAAGLLRDLPSGTRDLSGAAALVAAGAAATRAWLTARSPSLHR